MRKVVDDVTLNMREEQEVPYRLRERVIYEYMSALAVRGSAHCENSRARSRTFPQSDSRNRCTV